MGANADVEDVVQDAMIRAWRHASSCRSEDPLPWLLTIARREVFRRRTAVTEPVEESAVTADLAYSPDADVRLGLRQSLAALPPRDQVLLRLRYELDLTQPAIAEIMGTPEGTTKVQLHRARNRLKIQLEDDQ
jgi:RNA polymerase sigma-70 factor (ECF subfamily)